MYNNFKFRSHQVQIRTRSCNESTVCVCAVAVYELGETHILDSCNDDKTLHSIVRLADDVTVPEMATVTRNDLGTAYTVR